MVTGSIPGRMAINMIIKTTILPRGIVAITLFPLIFTRRTDNVTLTHERIHMRQQVELLVVFFYLLYFFEWLCKSYEDISFEREAYENESDIDYLKKRKMFAWVNYY